MSTSMYLSLLSVTTGPRKRSAAGRLREQLTAVVTARRGPRGAVCPGRNLALIEAGVALATLARGFKLALDPAFPPVHERFRFTMQPTGLRVLLQERE
jgi:hypothetical protein